MIFLVLLIAVLKYKKMSAGQLVSQYRIIPPLYVSIFLCHTRLLANPTNEWRSTKGA